MTEPRNSELEAAIVEEPESPDAFLVYGDWLLEQGDPLGELVTVQATLAKLRTRAGKTKEKAALAKREKLLLRDAEARLGPLATYEHTWSFGFLESLILSNPSAAQYEAVLAAPAARFLRELDIEDMARVATIIGAHPTFAMIARFGVGPTLRKLALTSPHPAYELGPVPPEFWSGLGSIRELTIRGGRFAPGQIVLPRLETLALAVPLTDSVLDALRTAELPRLASLQLDAHVDIASRLRPLLAQWAEAGTLRHLGITEHEVGNDLVDELLATEILPQLTSLDLSRAGLADRGARAILDHAASFEHLESLNLAANELSDAMCTMLERRFDLAVDVDEQGTRFFEE